MEEILIIEDDMNISDMVKEYLENEGYGITQVFDGIEAVKVLQNGVFDLVLLDLMIPGVTGMQVMKKIRETSFMPIIIMSAKDSDSDKAIGLGLGADDYVAKPFSLIELSARIKANIRRSKKYVTTESESEVKPLIHVGELEIDCANYVVKKSGRVIPLTAKEFKLLTVFALHKGAVYTKQQLYQLVWEEEYYGEENVINVHIRRLREKIEDNPSSPVYIKTLWGIGYKMEESL